MDLARAGFEQLAAGDFSALRDDQLWLFGANSLAEVCALLKETERAAPLYERLLPYAARCVYTGVATAYHGTVARALGQLAGTLRRWPQAQGHFEAALRIDARMGARPWMARTQYDYARMRLARNGDGDQNAARALLQQAHDTAQALGMQPLLHEVADCLADCGDDRPTQPVRRLRIATRKP
jgi:tetratricopeptide (TPR) repeat protein